MTNIHALASHQVWNPRFVRSADYRPSDKELVPFAQHMVDAATAEYEQTPNERVPCWILRFTLHFLSPERPSVVFDCLMVIAIALDCNPFGTQALRER